MLYFILAIIIVFILLSIISYNLFGYPLNGDGVLYYSYLPAVFIHHNLDLNFLYGIINPHSVYITELNKILIKYPYGVALCLSPFFFLAHLFTLIINTNHAKGYSFLYYLSMYAAAYFYCFIGIWINYKLLVKKFNKKIVAYSLFALTFGCGLFFYVNFQPVYSHTYSFCFISLFLYLLLCKNIKLKKNKILYNLVLGIILGIITAIKNLNFIIVLFYIFCNVDNFKKFKKRMLYLIKPKIIIPFIIGFFIIFFPQMLYWHNQTGHYLINSYSYNIDLNYQINVEESFNFLNPKFLEGLFSVKKGLFFYYPVLLFSIFGLFSIKKYYKDIKIITPIFLFLFSYLTFSWWCWWYGYSFGQRAFIDMGGIFVILLSSFLQNAKDKYNKIQYRAILILFFCCVLISLVIFVLIFLFGYKDYEFSFSLS